MLIIIMISPHSPTPSKKRGAGKGKEGKSSNLTVTIRRLENTRKTTGNKKTDQANDENGKKGTRSGTGAPEMPSDMVAKLDKARKAEETYEKEPWTTKKLGCFAG